MRVKPTPCILVSAALLAPIHAYAHDREGRHPVPIEQEAAKIPRTAKVSGYCCIVFDVTEMGRTENLRTTYCSEAYYEHPSLEAVSTWIYEPYVNDEGEIERFNDHTTKKLFFLKNQWGRALPGKNGFGGIVNGERNNDSPCSDYVS